MITSSHLSPDVPTLLLSSCLLGQEVRWDGGHKRSDWVLQYLRPWVNLLPVCPEMEMGLGAPREPMHLEWQNRQLRLISNHQGKDLTGKANEVMGRLVSSLPPIDGYLGTGKSPSCGLINVPHFPQGTFPQDPSSSHRGAGLFSGELLRIWPLLPTLESTLISDWAICQQFLCALFAHFHLRLCHTSRLYAMEFHQRNMLLIQARDPQFFNLWIERLSEEGFPSQEREIQHVLQGYQRSFLNLLQQGEKWVLKTKAIEQFLGKLSDRLPPEDRRNLQKANKAFGKGLLSWQSLRAEFLAHMQNDQLSPLGEQTIFHPFPLELERTHQRFFPPPKRLDS